MNPACRVAPEASTTVLVTGVTSRVVRVPFRSITKVRVLSADLRMAALSASQLVIAWPSMLTIRSPGLSPAAAAGDSVASAGQVFTDEVDGTTHCETLPIVVVATGAPKRQRTMPQKTK